MLHPRPSLARPTRWLLLDGAWEFRRDPADQGLAGGWAEELAGPWPEQITVPYVWETAASGIEAHWLPIGWYRTAITVPQDWAGARVFLAIGGLHHQGCAASRRGAASCISTANGCTCGAYSTRDTGRTPASPLRAPMPCAVTWSWLARPDSRSYANI
jgi:hypothetical protein